MMGLTANSATCGAGQQQANQTRTSPPGPVQFVEIYEKACALAGSKMTEASAGRDLEEERKDIEGELYADEVFQALRLELMAEDLKHLRSLTSVSHEQLLSWFIELFGDAHQHEAQLAVDLIALWREMVVAAEPKSSIERLRERLEHGDDFRRELDNEFARIRAIVYDFCSPEPLVDAVLAGFRLDVCALALDYMRRRAPRPDLRALLVFALIEALRQHLGLVQLVTSSPLDERFGYLGVALLDANEISATMARRKESLDWLFERWQSGNQFPLGQPIGLDGDD